MKKFTSLFTVIMLAMMSFTFISCDDDEMIADTLWGTWKGNMYKYYEYNGRTYKSSYSVIEFDKDYEYATHGSGYWIDYYSGAPWDYYASHIRWNVSNEIMTIYSIEDNTYYQISEYRLTNNYFEGYIDNEYGENLYFKMVKTSSPYWNDYTWGWNDWYSSPSYNGLKGTKGTLEGNTPVIKIGKVE
ncbi:MAG: hepatitis A virus cellular receptor 1 [Prevotella sp.]